MKQILRVCALALCLGLGLTWSSEAEAAPGFALAPLAAPGALGSMFNQAAVPAWRSSFVSLTKLELSPSLMGELGSLQQSFVSGLGVAYAVTYSIAAIAAIVALIGNIIALKTRRGRFIWGIVGIAAGGVAILLTSFFSFNTLEGILLFLPVAAVAVGAIILGIINLIGGIRQRRGFRRGPRRRYYRRRYYRRRRRYRDDGAYRTGGFRTEGIFNTASNHIVNFSF